MWRQVAPPPADCRSRTGTPHSRMPVRRPIDRLTRESSRARWRMSSPLAAVDRFARVRLGHVPTPLDAAPRLGAALGVELWVKRDDCTGLALGGNKVRQLEFHLGAAQAPRRRHGAGHRGGAVEPRPRRRRRRAPARDGRAHPARRARRRGRRPLPRLGQPAGGPVARRDPPFVSRRRGRGRGGRRARAPRPGARRRGPPTLRDSLRPGAPAARRARLRLGRRRDRDAGRGPRRRVRRGGLRLGQRGHPRGRPRRVAGRRRDDAGCAASACGATRAGRARGWRARRRRWPR